MKKMFIRGGILSNKHLLNAIDNWIEMGNESSSRWRFACPNAVAESSMLSEGTATCTC